MTTARAHETRYLPPRMSGADDTRDSAASRLDRLERIASALAGLLTPGEVADVILRDVAPELGGASRALWLLSDDGTQLELVHPESHARAQPYAAIPVTSDLPGAEVARTGEPLFLTTVADRDERYPVLRGLAPQVSIAALPLTASGRVVGVLACSYDEEHAFPADERRYLGVVTALASQALERSRLHGRQVEVATVLQASLLPPALPAIDGLELAAAYHPSVEGTEVGGDFYDAFPLGADRAAWVVAVGDVSGTGPAAAAVTAQVRHTLRAATRMGAGLTDAVTVVNDALADSLDPERFCTMVACSVGFADGAVALEIVTAGHPPALVVRVNGSVEEVTTGGWMLAAVPGPSFSTQAVQLGAGDALVLYTDGVIEARSRSREFFGLERLKTTIGLCGGRSAPEFVDAIETALFDFTGGHLEDDVAILVMRVTAGG